MAFITLGVKVSCLLRFTLAANLRAHTSQFRSGEVSFLLRFTPATNSRVQTSQLWSGKVSCLLRFTLAAISGAHTSQFGDGGLILYWSRIRKFVTYRIRKNVENRQRTDRQRKQLQRLL